ncbi:VCBS repeat-containing protein [Micromonospora sp. KC721]|uniref:FG-GAP repeat domain-containing protein n=1 Tax=Micromonospora sp. KC721 TaxID=2530380 RepID=UPI00140511A5|nr:VCBS repeat-containing protein [Micromonospora sp. KC721]
MGLRQIIGASAAASIIWAAPGAAAGAPLPDRLPGAAVVTSVDDPPDVEVPSDPAELPPPPEASILEKEQAGLIVNMPASSWEEYAKNDYQFTIELWRRAVFDTEVRAGAELAIGTYDPETHRCDACTTFVRTNIYAANDRDIRQETRDRTAAFEARYRRQAVADIVDYTFPDASAVGSGDRNFAFNIWEHLRATKPWATRSIAAAAAAVTATPDARVEFLTSFGAAYFYPDQADHLADIYAGDQEKKAEAERRAKRKYAGIAVGISFGQPGNEDESWYLVSDSVFLDRLYTRIENDPFYTLCSHAIAIVLYDEGPTQWREFINKGIHDVAAQDEERRRVERYEKMRAVVTAIRDDAERQGFKNRAIAANAALATGKLSALITFEQTYDRLPPDSSDLTAFYDNGTAASTLWVFGHVGRKTGTARRVWSAPAGWRALNAQPVNGEFDGKAGQDSAVLYKVGNFNYRLEVFGNVDAFTGAPRTVWELKPATSTTGHTLQTPVATDVNGDGRTDIVVYGTDAAKKPVLITLYGEAGGAFRQTTATAPAALVTGRAVAGDVNGDRKGDLVTFVQHATKGAQMWLALGADTGLGTPVERWSSTSVKLAEAGTPVMGDFDRDNRAEVAMFRKKSATTVAVWLHDSIASGTVSFAEKWTSPSGWTFDALFPVATDVNGDARTDLALMRRDDVAKASVWAVRAKSGGFDPAVQPWTSAKGTWRMANTRLSR